MAKTVKKFLLSLLALCVVAPLTLRAQAVTSYEKSIVRDTAAVNIIFKVDRWEIDPNYMTNKVVISTVEDLLGRIESNDGYTLEEVYIESVSSPEGSFKWNSYLSDERTKSSLNFLKQHGITNVGNKSIPENWAGALKSISNHKFDYKDEVVEIMSGVEQNEKSSTAAKNKLKKINSGRTWRYLIDNHFPKLRHTHVVIVYTHPDSTLKIEDLVEPEPEPVVPIVEDVPVEPEKLYFNYTKDNSVFDENYMSNADNREAFKKYVDKLESDDYQIDTIKIYIYATADEAEEVAMQRGYDTRDQLLSRMSEDQAANTVFLYEIVRDEDKTAAELAAAYGTNIDVITSPKNTEKYKLVAEVGTNLLYDLLVTPNVEAQVPIGKRFSVTWEDIFPWFNWGPNGNKYCYQHWEMGAEVRFWADGLLDWVSRDKEVLQGFFVGPYAMSSKYDIQNDRDIDYQGEYWSAGATLGYAWQPKWRLLRWCNMEITGSLGYFESDYRHYNPGNEYEKLYRDRKVTGTVSYFGPTKLKFTLYVPLYLRTSPAPGIRIGHRDASRKAKNRETKYETKEFRYE